MILPATLMTGFGLWFQQPKLIAFGALLSALALAIHYVKDAA